MCIVWHGCTVSQRNNGHGLTIITGWFYGQIVLFYEEGLGSNGLVCDSAPFIEWVTSYGLASQCGPPEVDSVGLLV
jgi:hypothetical protein